jgi:hypothetical protein
MGPKYVEVILKKLGAKPSSLMKQRTNTDSGAPAYRKFASDTRSLCLSRTDAISVLKEAQGLAATCKDGHARYRFMLNLFRMVSIVLFIQKNGAVMKVGSFSFSTWYENEASSKSFLKKLRHFQRVLHEEDGMKFPFPDDMNGR